jgi:hypothetical protein
LPKISENILPSTRRTLFRPGPTGQTPYQILVLTDIHCSQIFTSLTIFHIAQVTL